MNLFRLIDKLTGRWMDWRTDQDIKSLPPELRRLEFHKTEANTSGWEIIAFAPAIAFLADQASELLNALHAENYVQFDMMPRLDRGKPPIRVTVQWARGESPAMKAARLESENASLLGELLELKERLP